MIKLIDILKEINNTIQYRKPNFKKEWMEANRYPESIYYQGSKNKYNLF